MHEDYFALQLKLAEHYASVANVSLGLAIDRCTNLRRRLNLSGPAGAAAWAGVLKFANAPPNSMAAVLQKCLQLQTCHVTKALPSAFGCFSYDAPDDAGTVRIHFMPPDRPDSSPLSRANLSQRHDELCAMFSHIRRVERRAQAVRGVSWLYNLSAYQRLFPGDYIASIAPPRFPVHLNGSSTWGQMLDWRHRVKPEMQSALICRMPHMRADAPWEIFPLQALTAHCAIGAFYARYTR